MTWWWWQQMKSKRDVFINHWHSLTEGRLCLNVLLFPNLLVCLFWRRGKWCCRWLVTLRLICRRWRFCIWWRIELCRVAHGTRRERKWRRCWSRRSLPWIDSLCGGSAEFWNWELELAGSRCPDFLQHSDPLLESWSVKSHHHHLTRLQNKQTKTTLTDFMFKTMTSQ